MSIDLSIERVGASEEKGVELIELSNVENKLGSAEFDIDKERFALARGILLCLFLLTLFIISVRIAPDNIKDDNIKELFNTIFQSVVPMSSLIIGYYFGSKGKE